MSRKDRPVVLVSQAEISAIVRRTLRNGRFCAIKAASVKDGREYRMICAPIPAKVKATFTGTGRGVSPDCIALYACDRMATRTPRGDTIQEAAANGILYRVSA